MSNSIDVLLIGYENQENLGLRSIMSYLLNQGYKVLLVPFFSDFDAAFINTIRELNPKVIGFSIIFQFSIDDFGKLIRELRIRGVQSHFTAGGHFPSLRPAETFQLIPELDTIVRFEGELTISELLKYLDNPDEWINIRGLAFHKDRETILTPVRPLINNLDELPQVYRDKPKVFGCGIKMASILSSRGCLFNCSFCSIRQFYGSSGGQLRRMRSVHDVVKEMILLYNQQGVKFFSFQDDDFAARTAKQKQWIDEFLLALDNAGLSDNIRWKISCRVDDIDELLLHKMIKHGLAAVYLGVESGCESGLKTLNKHVTVEQNLRAIETIERNKIALAIGFMLFDPSSTMNTVEENISFLEAIGETGYFPINFCKMLPYAGTPIEKTLKEEGRLNGNLTRPDYAFAEDNLNWYSFFVQRIFTRRNFHSEGLVARLQEADFDVHLYNSFQPENKIENLQSEIKMLIKQSNKLAAHTLRKLWIEVSKTGADKLIKQEETLLEIADSQWRGDIQTEIKLNSLLAQFTTTLPDLAEPKPVYTG